VLVLFANNAVIYVVKYGKTILGNSSENSSAVKSLAIAGVNVG
jgi:hypothetical protein